MRRLICMFCMGVCLMMGCIYEHESGIWRGKLLYHVPDTQCILKALRELPEIQKIRVVSEGRVKSGGRPGINMIYEGNGFWVQFVVRIDEHGQLSFTQSNTMVSVHKRMSHDEIERTRAVMKAVEAKLVSQCGMKELVSGIEEEVMK